MNTWEAMEGVNKIEQFIISEIERLKSKPYNPRVRRQLIDGDRFLKMLHSMPYCEAKRVGQLRKIISKKRTELKEVTKDISKLLPYHQLSFFEEQEEASEERMEKLENQKKIIEEEIRWLHKALGICSNKDYFK